MFVAIGFAIVLAAVFGSFLAFGGNIAIIAEAIPHELIAIAGAALGAFIIANQTSVLKGAASGVVRAIKGPRWGKEHYRELLVMMFLVTDRMRKDGVQSLETDIDAPHDSPLFSRFPAVLADHHLLHFLCDYLRMTTIEQVEPHHISEAMDADIDRHHHETAEPQHALQTMADGLPAIGIVAAVLGVIKTMGSIDQPTEVLGAMIGGALVGTFLGVLISYCMVGPIASRLKQILDADAQPYLLVRSALLFAVSGAAPQVGAEVARRLSPSLMAPSFAELEEAISIARKVKTA